MYFLSLINFKHQLYTIELIHLFYYFFFLVGLILLLVGIAFTVAPYELSNEKISSYECGFEPFGDARTNFDVHFYLVGILFLIFDLEIVILYPWIFSISYFTESIFLNFNTLFIFLVLLGFGFIYEWKKQALVWSSSN